MLKGLRFQKRLTILPGLLRINLSKSGASASIGPRGADINIGKDGITANAGIPGTGVSYRRKVGGKGGWLAVLAVVGGLAFWAFQHADKITKFFAPAAPAMATSAPAVPPQATHAAVNTQAAGLRYVRRQGSVLRDAPKASGHALKKESKGAQVTLISESDGWAKVTDGTSPAGCGPAYSEQSRPAKYWRPARQLSV